MEVSKLGKVEFIDRVRVILGQGSFSYFILFIMVMICKIALMVLNVIKSVDKIS